MSNKIIKNGIVAEALPNATFRVKVDNQEKLVLCHLAGKMRIHHISVVPGDKVTVELTPYDDHRGRIIYREKRVSTNEG